MPRKSARQLWADKLAGRSVAAAVTAPSAVPVERVRFKGIVLGVDPSLRGTGLAVISWDGRQGQLLHSRTLKQIPTLPVVDCLVDIAQAVRDLIEVYQPEHVAVEQTIYVQNFQTAQVLGMVRGAVLTSAGLCGRKTFEYAPLRVKQAVVGMGRASKQQVAGTVRQLLGLPKTLPLDEADAAAIALCHVFTGGDS